MNDWIVPDWPAPPRVRTLITTRSGGVSRGSYASMNLASYVGDEADAVRANRTRLRGRLPAEPAWLEQVHGTAVADAERVTAGACADACVARRPGAVCAVQTADCLPVLLCDEAASVVAAAHAGWRGLAAGVIEETVRGMRARPAALLAFLGPAIGPGAFEVGPEVRDAFVSLSPDAAQAFAPGEGDRWLADLYLLARQRLAAAGVGRVFGAGWCTYSDPQRFFSFRRERVTGRMASLIWIEP
jgi:hypothetical protein